MLIPRAFPVVGRQLAELTKPGLVKREVSDREEHAAVVNQARGLFGRANNFPTRNIPITQPSYYLRKEVKTF